MKRIACLIGLLMLLASCTDQDGAVRVLTEQGYKDVRTTGYEFFSCGKGDNFVTGFEATSPAGVRVTGVVCSGWIKGSTIRFK